MKLLTKALEEKLLANGRASLKARGNRLDHAPVVKLFNPVGSQTWLLSELDEDGDTAFGLCDLGMGFAELGYVSLRELRAVKLPLGMRIERDMSFNTDRPMSEFSAQSRLEGRIVARVKNWYTRC